VFGGLLAWMRHEVDYGCSNGQEAVTVWWLPYHQHIALTVRRDTGKSTIVGQRIDEIDCSLDRALFNLDNSAAQCRRTRDHICNRLHQSVPALKVLQARFGNVEASRPGLRPFAAGRASH
jgi:hypothetical protein